MSVLDFFLKPQERKLNLIIKMAGYCFLILSGLVGTYFLLQALPPWSGHVENGGVICLILAILGSCFLFIETKKELSLPEEISEKIRNFFKDLNTEKSLKGKALTLSIFSLGIGIILRLIKYPKKFLGLYRISI